MLQYSLVVACGVIIAFGCGFGRFWAVSLLVWCFFCLLLLCGFLGVL